VNIFYSWSTKEFTQFRNDSGIELEFEKCWFLKRGETRDARRKTLEAE